jgi:Protein of unknown function (DUF3644)/EC042_2821-lke REase
MGKRGNPGLKGQLLNKSIEAYILALETINRLSITYRVETFAYLICNAWELLLKARLLHLAGNNRAAIYYKRQKKEDKRTLALRDCVDKIFCDPQDPVRRNIELIADLRDQAVHLVISQVPREVLALFQASVINYHKFLGNWFSVSLSDRVSVGMMTIVYDFKPEEFDISSPILRKKMGAETARYLTQYQAQLKAEFENLGKVAEFSISLDYRLTLIKSGSPDIELILGQGGEVTNIVEVAKDSGRSHPHRQKDVVALINAALPSGETIKPYDIQCIVKVFNVKKNAAYYYQCSVPSSPAQYSQAFVDYVLTQYKNKPDFFEQTRKKCKTVSA